MPKQIILRNLRNYTPPTSYALHMERLRNKIFGEPAEKQSSQNDKIVRLMKKMPMEENKYRVDYYPPHPMFHYLMKMLRLHGLYRDEHLDFREEMLRVKLLRGKKRPHAGEARKKK